MSDVKTLVIGIDAATWVQMRPLLDAGTLPHIQALMDAGTVGELRSTTPPMTPLAWTSMATGVNPGKHGIYDFVSQDRTTYQISPNNLTRMPRPTIWDLFSTHGRPIGVLNWPLCYPPAQVKPFFTSGIGSPSGGQVAYPPELNARLKSLNYRIYTRLGPNNTAEDYFNDVKELTEIQANLLVELMKESDWELLWAVFMGVDWVQHYHWEAEVDDQRVVEKMYCFNFLKNSVRPCRLFNSLLIRTG